MGKVLEFKKRAGSVLPTPTLAAITNAPERGPDTPERQSGQPAFLFFFPDGRVHLRTTPTGYRALQLAQDEDDIPLGITFSTHPSGSVPVAAEGLLPSRELGDFLALKLALDPWLVVHAYRVGERDSPSGYERTFSRVTPAPLPAPHLRYLWAVDFGSHGGLWVFGTPRDLAVALELVENNDLLTLQEVERRGEEVECFSLDSRRAGVFLSQVQREGFWVRQEDAWCSCH